MTDAKVLDDESRIWLKVHEVSDLIGVSAATLTRMAVAGRIPGAFKPARRWLFRREVIREWIERDTTKLAEA